MSMKKLTTHRKRQTPLTWEEKRRRQRLANLEGICVIAALLGLGAVIGAGLRGGLR